MGMIVRLPLQGNLDNKGTANVTVTVSGTTSYADGRKGQALSCNGSSFWTIVGVTLGAEASITYWAKTSTANKMPWVIVATSNSSLNLYHTTSGYCLNTGDGSNNLFKNDSGTAVTTLTDNQWHHFTVTFGNSEAKLYIDGVYKGKAITFKSPATTSANTIKLAGGFSGGHSYDFNGMISDFRVYDYCLNEAEVRSHLVDGKGLQIWLPLNGNVNNQGLANVTITNNDATVSDNGKIGKCYSFDGTDDRITISGLTLGNEWSYGLWVYSPTSTRSWESVVLLNSSSGDSDTQLGFYTYPNSHRIQSTANGQYNSNLTLTSDKWFHLFATFDGSNLKTYIDGILIDTKSITNSLLQRTNLTIGARSSNTNGANTSATTYFSGYLNDFRLYDYALSEKEVKELAKGLVLHYKLSGAGNENNIANSKIANRSCTSFSYSGNEGTLVCPVNSSTWGVGLVINDTSIKWTSGQTWLISMEVYTPQSITWNCDINNKPDLDDVSSYTGNDYDITAQRYAYTNGVSSKTLQAGWNKIWFSQTAPTTYGLYNYSTNWGVVTSSLSEPITIKIKNVKGEVIDSGLPILPTPWIPNSADAKYSLMGYNNDIEYDISGYGNNGTKTGTLPSNSNTPKYFTSTYISNGANARITTPSLTFNPNAVTLNIWFKSMNTSPTNNYHMVVDSVANRQWYEICVNSGGFFRGGLFVNGTRYADNCTSTTALNGQWHMLTLSYDGSIIKRYYDGQLEKSTSVTASSGLSSPTALVLGRDGPNANYACKEASISDFRIYATALSADDIAELYNGGVL